MVLSYEKKFNNQLSVLFLIAFIIFSHLFSSAAFAAKKKIIVTFFPLYVHVLNIAGDRLEIDLLLPPGVSAHDYNCKPSDIKKLASASLLIANGASFDNFASRMAESASNPSLKIIDASYGVELIGASGCAHECADESCHEGEHRSEGEKLPDPHTWLSLTNAVVQVNNITLALCEIDPDGASSYKESAAKYLLAIAELEKLAQEKLSLYKSNKFIVFHGSFAYFSRDYGLIQSSIADSFGNSPKPSKIKEIYDLIKKDGIKFLVAEPAYQNKEIKVISEEYKLEVIELDPMCFYRSASDAKSYFLNVMKDNISKLASAFERAGKR